MEKLTMLKKEIIASGLEKGKKYKKWEKMLGIHPEKRTNNEWDMLEESQKFMRESEYVGIKGLIENEYLKDLSDVDGESYGLGRNNSDVFLSKVAEIYSEEKGFLTKSENDYYEIARCLGELCEENKNLLEEEKMKKAGFIQTDENQFVKIISETVFHVCDKDSVGGVFDEEIDIKDYSESALESYIDGYYDSMKELKESVEGSGISWQQIVAEIIAEQSSHDEEENKNLLEEK